VPPIAPANAGLADHHSVPRGGSVRDHERIGLKELKRDLLR
jgi:hypothetical protein